MKVDCFSNFGGSNSSDSPFSGLCKGLSLLAFSGSASEVFSDAGGLAVFSLESTDRFLLPTPGEAERLLNVGIPLFWVPGVVVVVLVEADDSFLATESGFFVGPGDVLGLGDPRLAGIRLPVVGLGDEEFDTAPGFLPIGI